MTRDKSLRRLERAIEEQNVDDLEWALHWCERRLSTAPMKHHEKHWRKLIKRIEAALTDLRE